jgi:quercetin dioxygenase-like cupin family protein
MHLSDPNECKTVFGSEWRFLTQLVVGEELSLQNVRIAPCYATLSHSHSHEQVGYVVSGEFLFGLERVGDFVAAPV